MYGPGVYTTYKLSTQGQNARGVYGDIMYKAKVRSLRNFVIYDPIIAARVYGTNHKVVDQLKKILTPEQFDRMKHNRYYAFDKLVNSRDDSYTAPCALSMCEYFRYADEEAGYQVAGYIFSGNHDGWVCFIKDFKNIIPIEMSYNCGKTWEPFKPTKNFKNFAADDVDLKFQLGKHNYPLLKELQDVPYYFINGFAKITNMQGKFNYLYRKRPLKYGPISPVWFDYAPDTFTKKGTANVMIDNNNYILKLDATNSIFRVFDSEGRYLCNLDDLPIALEMNYSNEDDFGTDDF